MLTTCRDYTVVGGQPNRVTGECMSPLTVGQVIPYTSQADNGSWVDVKWSVTSATSINAVVLQGWNVNRSGSSTASQTAASSTSTSLTNNSDQGTSSSGLSTGAKAGIGIGAALAVIAIVSAIFFMFKRKRRTDTTATLSSEQLMHEPAGTPSAVEKPAMAIHEIQSTERTTYRPVEMPTNYSMPNPPVYK